MVSHKPINEDMDHWVEEKIKVDDRKLIPVLKVGLTLSPTLKAELGNS